MLGANLRLIGFCIENFKIAQDINRMPKPIIQAFAYLKKAAAITNFELGRGPGSRRIGWTWRRAESFTEVSLVAKHPKSQYEREKDRILLNGGTTADMRVQIFFSLFQNLVVC